jgi:hypothetical protein
MPRVYPARTVLAQRIRERRLTFEELSEQLKYSPAKIMKSVR